ncbi:MAG: cytochrome c, partial [Betaproteobacteria bacterium]|nr:cytochrome c [Betaproteobacteria bacterium]
MRKAGLFLAAAAFAVMAGNAASQAKPEDAIKYRQSVYQVLLWNWLPMGAMVKGEKPFDKDVFLKNAIVVDQMGRMALEGFTPGSDKGTTKAKPEIWSKMDDFKAKMNKMNEETAKLVAVAKTGN